MYLDHFGLTEAPFRITPHTGFFFGGANRGATLEALLYAITHDEGIIKISGEVGSGKTMLCRVLMEKLPKHVDIIFLASPSLSREDMLYTIATDLQLEIPPDARLAQLLRSLQELLIKRYSEGRRVVVLVDEAHAMPLDSLEEIRLLSNLESNQHKLLQLVLFGQPELNEILARKDMRQLKERITHNFYLEPLIRTDVGEYLEFRLRTAGYHGPHLFPPAAIHLIAKASHGLTRRINILADKALLAAYAANSHNITPKIVRSAIRDSEFSNISQEKKWLYAGLGSALALSIALVASTPLWKSTTPLTSATANATAPETQNTPVAAVATPPQAAPISPPAAAPTSPAVEPPPPAIGASLPANLKKLTRARAEATLPWLLQVNDQRWFIQLQAADATRADYLEDFITKANRSLRSDELRVYVSSLGEKQRVGIIYGDFSSQNEAKAKITQLPKELRAFNPYPRQVKRLR